MKCVYLLASIKDPRRRYVGITDDLDSRIIDHNSGKSPHTSKYKPWKVVVSILFEDGQRAMDFEKYLKSGSGRAFANKHFW